MRPEALEYLGCPACHSPLHLEEIQQKEGEHILFGKIRCEKCSHTFPIVRGIPRLLLNDIRDYDWHDNTIKRFGKQWQTFREVAHPFYEQQFLSFIHPVRPEFFQGKVVLDAGCGKGRHLIYAARWGAKAVIGVDLSEAVEVSFANTAHLPQVHVVQGDIFHLPLQLGKIDYAFSIGVIHHTPDPEEAFRCIAKVVRQGGALSIWVYGKENNYWVEKGVGLLRRYITSRLPHSALMVLSFLMTVPLYLAIKLLYRWRPLQKFLPYSPYLSHLVPFSFREIWLIVYDHLTPSVAYYLSREEFAGYWRRLGIEPQLYWRNQNSWAGFGHIRNPIKLSKRKLNLGSGNFPKEGFLNVDYYNRDHADVIHNLEIFPYPFEDNQFDLVEINHCLEHLSDPLRVMCEIHRITRPGGLVRVRVPHFSRGFTHPDHKRGFDVTFFYYFDPTFKGGYTGVTYKLRRLKLHWFGQKYLKKLTLKPYLFYPALFVGYIIDLFANLSPFLAARLWCFWVGGFEEIFFEFEVVKEWKLPSAEAFSEIHQAMAEELQTQ
ncbi:MAG: methyltransferase domain-containing protein [Bacteroidia bacterium]|nr:methyltransferase domain-containing protein [Bacteroidia bacterium]MDW8088820.1 methyltransferase domain-containing protein [Bacteroidia bacterium]